LTCRVVAQQCAAVVSPWRHRKSKIRPAIDRGQWLADHVPGAQLVTVPGGRFGPRDKEEEQLIAWLASREA
jgi:hypothetical protein